MPANLTTDLVPLFLQPLAADGDRHQLAITARVSKLFCQESQALLFRSTTGCSLSRLMQFLEAVNSKKDSEDLRKFLVHFDITLPGSYQHETLYMRLADRVQEALPFMTNLTALTIDLGVSTWVISQRLSNRTFENLLCVDFAIYNRTDIETVYKLVSSAPRVEQLMLWGEAGWEELEKFQHLSRDRLSNLQFLAAGICWLFALIPHGDPLVQTLWWRPSTSYYLDKHSQGGLYVIVNKCKTVQQLYLEEDDPYTVKAILTTYPPHSRLKILRLKAVIAAMVTLWEQSSRFSEVHTLILEDLFVPVQADVELENQIQDMAFKSLINLRQLIFYRTDTVGQYVRGYQRESITSGPHSVVQVMRWEVTKYWEDRKTKYL